MSRAIRSSRVRVVSMARLQLAGAAIVRSSTEGWSPVVTNVGRQP